MYHLRLKGDHYQMGVKRGTIFQKGNISFPLHLDAFQLEHGKQSEQILKKYFPEVCEEIRGVSDTIGADYLSFASWIREAIKSDGDSIVCTVNSFTSDEYTPFDDANGDDYDSGKRYKVVVDSFTNKIKDNYLEETKQLLMGKYGFMCQYEDPNFETVWSSIFDLESLMIYRAEGDPRKKRFISDNRLHGMKFGR